MKIVISNEELLAMFNGKGLEIDEVEIVYDGLPMVRIDEGGVRPTFFIIDECEKIKKIHEEVQDEME